jgi:hypothetical protein
MSNYKEQLLTKDWKYKRFKILKRDSFKCTVCGSKKELRVHHTYYYKNFVSPWLYPDSCLLTVCEKCHLEFHMNCEVEVRDNPVKKKIIKVRRKNKKNKNHNNPKHLQVKFRYNKSVCLAEIQANPNDFQKDDLGTWKRKKIMESF